MRSVTIGWSASVVLLAGALSLLCGCTEPRPNVVLVVTDDQRFDTLEWMPVVQDRLVDRGLRFENAIVTTSLCCPSRASILSGQYAHKHGIVTLGGAPRFDARSTLATWLGDAGYTTAMIGKYLNDNAKLAPAVPPGWNEWRTFVDTPWSFGGDSLYYGYTLNENGELREYGTLPSEYSTDVLAELAFDFLMSAEEPFFLYFAPFAPHAPGLPAPRHAGRLANVKLPEPPSLREADTSDKPPYVQLRRAAVEGDSDDPIAMAWAASVAKIDRRAELELLLAVDEALEAMLDALQERGLGRRTLVVYTSDNGRLRGEHWSWNKNDPYEESVKVPLVMRLPGRISAGTTSDELVANIDLAPTIAELVGLEPPDSVDGASLVPVIDGGSLDRDGVLLEWWYKGRPTVLAPGFRGLRTRGWKFVEYADGFEEAYDLHSDPNELENFTVTQPAHPKIAELRERLAARVREAGPMRAGGGEVEAAGMKSPFSAVADAGFQKDRAPWFRRPFDMVATDMDLDGDPDLLINWHHHEPLELYENRDGRFVRRNAVGDDPSGLYDNRRVPYLFATTEEMLRRIESDPKPGLHLWHDSNRGGSWRFLWLDEERRYGGLRLSLESSLPVVGVDGLEPEEITQPDDRRARVELDGDASRRLFGLRVRRVATQLVLRIDPGSEAEGPPVFVGTDLTELGGGELELWKPDPHGMAWVDVTGTRHPELFITRGGLGGELAPPAPGKDDRYYLHTGDDERPYERAPVGVVPRGYGRGRHVEWVDVDGDGALELSIGNDRSANALLVWDQERAKFRDRAPDWGIDLEGGSVQAWSDFDGDGLPDLFYLDDNRIDVMRNRPGKEFESVRGDRIGLGLPPAEPAAGVIQPTSMQLADYDNDGDLDLWLLAYGREGGNHLFRREGDRFRDVSADVGLNVSRGSRFVVLLDLDNDGFEDAVSLGRDVVLWRNRAGRRFELVPLPPASLPGQLFAAVACDVDGDGRTDLVAAGRQRHLLRNAGSSRNGYVDVVLRDEIGEPVGAVVRARYSDGTVRAQRYGSARNSAFSQALGPLHFGIPEGLDIMEVGVQWPGQSTEAIYAVQERDARVTITRRPAAGARP